MNISILTCGRSDYSIYRPLLTKLAQKKSYNVTLVAFGTHLAKEFGETLRYIKKDGFAKILTVKHNTGLGGRFDNAEAMADCTKLFAKYWRDSEVDLIFSLGDRFEMFAAVAASIPFDIPVAHIHGGEKSLGAMDNIFRDAITSMSTLHFTTCTKHATRVKQILGNNSDLVFNVGSLGVEAMKNCNLFNPDKFKNEFGVDLSLPTALVTCHPETKGDTENYQKICELLSALDSENYQKVFTLPNNDFDGKIIAKEIKQYCKSRANCIAFESLGVAGYYSALFHCSFLLGNSSSGIIESASFGKWFINVGARQQGRVRSKNVLDVAFDRNEIGIAINKIRNRKEFNGVNIFDGGNTSSKIISAIEEWQTNGKNHC